MLATDHAQVKNQKKETAEAAKDTEGGHYGQGCKFGAPSIELRSNQRKISGSALFIKGRFAS